MTLAELGMAFWHDLAAPVALLQIVGGDKLIIPFC
ncbi:type I toxin-antitoxin system toxin Ldr family protein [Escherichia coli]|nr:type I toxin-antitoxin system toxin Ldr family protein [Escherichia coli]